MSGNTSQLEPIRMHEVLAYLNSENVDTAGRGIYRLYKQIVAEAGEGLYTTAEEFLSLSNGGTEILRVIAIAKGDYGVTAKVFNLMQVLFLYAGDHPMAIAMSKGFLRKNLKAVYKVLGAEDTAIAVTAIRVLAACNKLSLTVSRELLHKLNFKLKEFNRLPFRPYSAKVKGDQVAAANEGRQLFIELALDALAYDDVELTRYVLGISNFMSSFLKNLADDNVETVQNVLTSLEKHVLLNSRVGYQAISSFFDSFVVEQLLKLYECGEDTEAAVHHFLTRLVDFYCSNALQQGDKETDSRDETSNKERRGKNVRQSPTVSTSGPTSVLDSLSPTLAPNQGELSGVARALLKLILKLKSNEDDKQQELALKVLTAIPSLVLPYIRGMRFAFEPRPSSRWISNMTILCKVLSLPHPFPLQRLVNSEESVSAGIEALLSSIVPHSMNKASLSHGLQHSAFVVKFMTLTTIVKLFDEVETLVAQCEALADTGKTNLAPMIVDAFRRLVPDIQVVLAVRSACDPAVVQSSSGSTNSSNGMDVEVDGASDSANKTVDASVLGLADQGMVYAQFLNTVERYQHVIPESLTQAKVDVWKLLSIHTPSTSDSACLHMSRIISRLSVSDPRLFAVTRGAKATDGSSEVDTHDELYNHSHVSNLGLLLHLLVRLGGNKKSTESRAGYTLLYSYVADAFHASGLFHGHTFEICVWLDALSRDVICVWDALVCAVNRKRFAYLHSDDSLDRSLSPFMEAVFASLKSFSTSQISEISLSSSLDIEVKAAFGLYLSTVVVNRLAWETNATSAPLRSAIGKLLSVDDSYISGHSVVKKLAKVFGKKDDKEFGLRDETLSYLLHASTIVYTEKNNNKNNGMDTEEKKSSKGKEKNEGGVDSDDDDDEGEDESNTNATTATLPGSSVQADAQVSIETQRLVKKVASGKVSADEGFSAEDISSTRAASVAALSLTLSSEAREALSCTAQDSSFGVLKHAPVAFLAGVDTSFQNGLFKARVRDMKRRFLTFNKSRPCQAVLDAHSTLILRFVTLLRDVPSMLSANDASLVDAVCALNALMEYLGMLLKMPSRFGVTQYTELVRIFLAQGPTVLQWFAATSEEAWSSVHPREMLAVFNEHVCSILSSFLAQGVAAVANLCRPFLTHAVKQSMSVRGGASWEELPVCLHCVRTLDTYIPLSDRLDLALSLVEAGLDNDSFSLLLTTTELRMSLFERPLFWQHVQNAVSATEKQQPLLRTKRASLLETRSVKEAVVRGVLAAQKQLVPNADDLLGSLFQRCKNVASAVSIAACTDMEAYLEWVLDNASYLRVDIVSQMLRLIGHNTEKGRLLFQRAAVLLQDSISNSPDTIDTLIPLLSLVFHQLFSEAELPETYRSACVTLSGMLEKHVDVLVRISVAKASSTYVSSPPNKKCLELLSTVLYSSAPELDQLRDRIDASVWTYLSCGAIGSAGDGVTIKTALSQNHLNLWRALLRKSANKNADGVFSFKVSKSSERVAVFCFQTMSTIASLVRSDTVDRSEEFFMYDLVAIIQWQQAANDPDCDVDERGYTDVPLLSGMTRVCKTVGVKSKAVSRIYNKFVSSILKYRYTRDSYMSILASVVSMQYCGSGKTTPLTRIPSMSLVEEVKTPRMIYEFVASHSLFVATLVPDLKDSVTKADRRLQAALINVLTALFRSTVDAPKTGADENLGLQRLLRAAYMGTVNKRDQNIKTLLAQFGVSLSDWREPWGRHTVKQLLAEQEGTVSENELKSSEGWIYSNFSSFMLRQGPAPPSLPEEITTAFENERSLLSSGEGEGDRSLQYESLPKAVRGSSVLPNMTSVVVGQPRYDPFVCLPLFQQFMSDVSADVRRLIDTGVVSYIVYGLASGDKHVRMMAYASMAQLFVSVEAAESAQEEFFASRKQRFQDREKQKDRKRIRIFKEQPQVLTLLTILKNAITKQYQQIPLLSASFVCQSLEVLLRPEHELYKALNKFLLQRPQLDLHDVPLFYNLFHSSTLNHVSETQWLLRLIHNGVGSEEDLPPLRRRHVLSMLMSYFVSSAADKTSRLCIVETISRACAVPEILLELLDNGGLLAWLRSVIDTLLSPNSKGMYSPEVLAAVIQLANVTAIAYRVVAEPFLSSATASSDSKSKSKNASAMEEEEEEAAAENDGGEAENGNNHAGQARWRLSRHACLAAEFSILGSTIAMSIHRRNVPVSVKSMGCLVVRLLRNIVRVGDLQASRSHIHIQIGSMDYLSRSDLTPSSQEELLRVVVRSRAFEDTSVEVVSRCVQWVHAALLRNLRMSQPSSTVFLSYVAEWVAQLSLSLSDSSCTQLRDLFMSLFLVLFELLPLCDTSRARSSAPPKPLVEVLTSISTHLRAVVSRCFPEDNSPVLSTPSANDLLQVLMHLTRGSFEPSAFSDLLRFDRASLFASLSVLKRKAERDLVSANGSSDIIKSKKKVKKISRTEESDDDDDEEEEEEVVERKSSKKSKKRKSLKRAGTPKKVKNSD